MSVHLEWSLSNKMKECPVVNSFKFVLHKEYKDKSILWKCSNYKNRKCYCKTKQKQFIKGFLVHNHEASYTQCKKILK